MLEGDAHRLGRRERGRRGGGVAGDLYLDVEFKPHHLYRVDGRDLYLDLPLAPWEAALGTRLEVPTLGGRVQMNIPPGSQSGQRLRLKGRGLPGKVAGDQYLVLSIVTPPVARSSSSRKVWIGGM